MVPRDFFISQSALHWNAILCGRRPNRTPDLFIDRCGVSDILKQLVGSI